MEEKLGTRFGNYELVRRIDVGGMGEVYLAHQLTAFGRDVAIKIIRSDLVHDTTARARFLREAEVSAHLKHEHILSLFDFGEVDGRLYLVTPYIQGGTLAARLQQSGPLSLEETHQLFVPLVQAVAYVHRRGVIHRDLKPTNIMLDMEDGEVYVRLIDFGIASLQGQSASPPLTTAGHEMGTVAYMAPERLSGIAAPSNDIFSLGVILHQMLTARMPTAGPPSPRSQVPRLPEPLAQVVRKAVVSNPAERYATADELLKGFEQAYQQMHSLDSAKQPALTPILNRQTQSQHASRPEAVSLAHSGELAAMPPAPAHTPVVFSQEDYNAPTTAFKPFEAYPYAAPPTNRPPLIRPQPPKPPRQKRRKSFVLVISTIMALVILAIAGMLYYGYQVVSAAAVTVTFAPKTQVLSQVVALKADPAAQTADPLSGTVRAYSLSSSKTTEQTGNTTGQVGCFFFDCQQGVDQNDVVNLVNQILPGLQQSISQDLQNQVNAQHGTEISWVNFSTPQVASNPQIGFPGKHVTVRVSEQASVGYIMNSDETTMANHALTTAAGQLGAGFQLVPTSVTIGHPATKSIDPNSGVSSIAIPVGALARYQFTSAQLQAISAALENKSVAAAQTYLKKQPGIDPTSISIHFADGSGSTMPGDPQHITLKPMNGSTLPDVSLTPVVGLTPTPTPTFPTDNGNGD
jgi:serine/threonine protein kinase